MSRHSRYVESLLAEIVRPRLKELIREYADLGGPYSHAYKVEGIYIYECAMLNDNKYTAPEFEQKFLIPLRAQAYQLRKGIK